MSKVMNMCVALAAGALASCSSGGSSGGGGGGFPVQNGSLSIDLTSAGVTITQQPSRLFLSATAVYDDPGDMLTVSLTVRNDFSRLLFNLKGITQMVNEGTQTGTMLPGGGLPYTYYGPEGLDRTAMRTENLVFTGITGAVDPIEIDLTFEDAAMLFGGNFGGDFLAIDTSLSGEVFETGIIGTNSLAANVRQAVVAADGEFVYTGDKENPNIGVIDTRTYTIATGPDLSGTASGSIGGITLSANGSRIYGVVNVGTHAYGAPDGSGGVVGSTTVDVVAVDESSLIEVGRLNLFTMDAGGRFGGRIELSPDGSRLAVIVGTIDGSANELWLINTASFSLVDTDAGTAGVQPVTLSAPGAGTFAQQGCWSGNDRFLVGFNDHRFGGNMAIDIDVVNTSNFAVTQLTPTGAGEAAGVMTARNGEVYYPTRDGTSPFSIFTLSNSNERQPDPAFSGGTEACGIVFNKSGSRYYVANYNDLAVFETTGDVRVDTDNDGGNGVTNILLPEQIRAHFLTMSRN